MEPTKIVKFTYHPYYANGYVYKSDKESDVSGEYVPFGDWEALKKENELLQAELAKYKPPFEIGAPISVSNNDELWHGGFSFFAYAPGSDKPYLCKKLGAGDLITEWRHAYGPIGETKFSPQEGEPVLAWNGSEEDAEICFYRNGHECSFKVSSAGVSTTFKHIKPLPNYTYKKG